MCTPSALWTVSGSGKGGRPSGAVRRRWGLVRKEANGQTEPGSGPDSANCQLGHWVNPLVSLNSRFVICKMRLVGPIRGLSWDDARVSRAWCPGH